MCYVFFLGSIENDLEKIPPSFLCVYLQNMWKTMQKGPPSLQKRTNDTSCVLRNRTLVCKCMAHLFGGAYRRRGCHGPFICESQFH